MAAIYTSACEKVPDLEQFTQDEFCQILALEWSRAFGINIDGE